MYYIGVTEGKIEKEGKMSFSIYTIHLANKVTEKAKTIYPPIYFVPEV